MPHAMTSTRATSDRSFGTAPVPPGAPLPPDRHRSGRTGRPGRSAILVWIAAGLVTALLVNLVALASGAAGTWIDQRAHGLGHTLDRLVGATARGEAGAWTLLLGGAALYGFLHALGPGHGKVLVGSVGVGSSVTVRRLMGLSLLASLAQALWAIALVYGALAVLDVSVAAVTDASRDVLAPLGGLLIAGIGALLIWRAVGPTIVRAGRAGSGAGSRGHSHDGPTAACGHEGHHAHHDHAHHDHAHPDHAHPAQGRRDRGHRDHAHGEGCGCAHAPSLDAVSRLERPRDAVALVLGIAVRPCTSALVLLALAWQAGVAAAGASAAIAMGLGTAALVCLVAGSSVTARRVALLSAASSAGSRAWMGPALRALAGATLVFAGVTLVRVASGA